MKIQIENLDLHFDTKQVLKNVNMNIEDKKVIALIGPSGCGKSTLLRSINRMHDLNPSAKLKGNILLDNNDIFHANYDSSELRKKVGMVFQKPNPFPKSIFDNITYGLKLHYNHSKKELEEIVNQSLTSCHLINEIGDNLHKSALELSGGQQQRLCIARTISVKPEVILMDEPCSALDPISTQKIEDLILLLKNDYCIVIVTHNMQQARRVADYTAFMYMGELIEYGTTEQIFTNPQHELTQKYLSGNFG